MYDIQTELSLDQKLEILSDAAKYDVACTSSGVDRSGKEGFLGNSVASGVCHTFAADGRCISLLKILMTNHCIYDCKYCKNRVTNDVSRATFTPEEICTLTTEFYKRNYIEGLFLSSGVIKNPDYTMEKICETLRLLRTKYRFNGYIHVKAIPGASGELLYSAGLLADRISLNMELPTQASLRALAPNKTMTNIIRPMNQITDTIAAHRVAIGKDARMERAVINDHLMNTIFGRGCKAYGVDEIGNKGTFEGISGGKNSNAINEYSNIPNSNLSNGFPNGQNSNMTNGFSNTQNSNIHFDSKNTSGNSTSNAAEFLLRENDAFMYPADKNDKLLKRPFAPGGQSTQMIIGATSETDYELIHTSQALYRSFDLKRVFYSAYIPINEDPLLPSLNTPAPLLREHRLYQADFLLRYYGFQAGELLSEQRPFFDNRVDPKCDWAIRHLNIFPVEINKAGYDVLLRVPGIGPTSVKRIISARHYGSVNFEMLKKMGVVLKRARFFITCNGKMMDNFRIEENFILSELADTEKRSNARIASNDSSMVQMNLFNDFGLKQGVG